MSTDGTPVAANTQSNNPTLVTATSPLPRRVLMDRGEESKDNDESKAEDTADPPPVDPPPPPPARQADLDSDNNSIMSATETDYLKYLASEYKTFKASPDLSDVITLERKLGTALWNIPNKYKVGGWSHVVDDDDTHKVRLGITGAYTPVMAPT